MTTTHLHVAVPLEKRERPRDSLAREPQVIADIGPGHEQMEVPASLEPLHEVEQEKRQSFHGVRSAQEEARAKGDVVRPKEPRRDGGTGEVIALR